MRDGYMTIAEFAKAAGVTRQAVYKRLSTDLQKFTDIDNGVKCIDSKALELFGSKPVEHDASTTIIDLAAHLQKQHDTLSHLVDVLEDDLSAKNRQIDDLSRKLDTSQLLLDQQQQLNAHALLTGASGDYERGVKDGKEKALADMQRAAKILYERFPEAAAFLIDELDR